jgi:signal peptidase II
VFGLVAAAVTVLCLDQWSKRAVRASTRQPVFLAPHVRIRAVSTTRPSFVHHERRMRLVLAWVGALIATVALHRLGTGFQSQADLAGAGAALGGAAGNLLDILRRRAVTDFIDLGWWPVFNLADVGIVCGLLVAFWPRG